MTAHFDRISWTPISERPLLPNNFYLSSQISEWPFLVTAQTAFHHCTFRFITAHFVHHCTLKQALDYLEIQRRKPRT